MSIRDSGVNFFDALNGQNISCRFTGELIGAMACTDSDGQSINLSLFNEFSGLVRISQELVFSHCSVCSVTVFFVAFHSFQRT